MENNETSFRKILKLRTSFAFHLYVFHYPLCNKVWNQHLPAARASHSQVIITSFQYATLAGLQVSEVVKP